MLLPLGERSDHSKCMLQGLECAIVCIPQIAGLHLSLRQHQLMWDCKVLKPQLLFLPAFGKRTRL